MKGLFTLIGFLIFLIGMSALVLSLVGVKLSFLTFIDQPSPMIGFLIRLVMVFGGIIIIVLAQTDWQKERQ